MVYPDTRLRSTRKYQRGGNFKGKKYQRGKTKQDGFFLGKLLGLGGGATKSTTYKSNNKKHNL
jgi:hypothetical protein